MKRTHRPRTEAPGQTAEGAHDGLRRTRGERIGRLIPACQGHEEKRPVKEKHGPKSAEALREVGVLAPAGMLDRNPIDGYGRAAIENIRRPLAPDTCVHSMRAAHCVRLPRRWPDVLLLRNRSRQSSRYAGAALPAPISSGPDKSRRRRRPACLGRRVRWLE